MVKGSGEAHSGPIRNIVFACDAGMGSSAMGASVLRKKIKDAGFGDVTVVNRAISNLDDSWDLVVTHQDLAGRAFPPTPSAVHVTVDNFMASPKYDDVAGRWSSGQLRAAGHRAGGSRRGRSAARRLPVHRRRAARPAARRGDRPGGHRADPRRGDRRGGPAAGRHRRRRPRLCRVDARPGEVGVHLCGQQPGHPARHQRGQAVDPSTGLSFIRYADGIDWNGDGQLAHFVVGIAGAGDDHLTLLGSLAHVFLDEEKVAALTAATSKADVAAVLDSVALA